MRFQESFQTVFCQAGFQLGVQNFRVLGNPSVQAHTSRDWSVYVETY